MIEIKSSQALTFKYFDSYIASEPNTIPTTNYIINTLARYTTSPKLPNPDWTTKKNLKYVNDYGIAIPGDDRYYLLMYRDQPQTMFMFDKSFSREYLLGLKCIYKTIGTKNYYSLGCILSSTPYGSTSYIKYMSDIINPLTPNAMPLILTGALKLPNGITWLFHQDYIKEDITGYTYFEGTSSDNVGTYCYIYYNSISGNFITITKLNKTATESVAPYFGKQYLKNWTFNNKMDDFLSLVFNPELNLTWTYDKCMKYLKIGIFYINVSERGIITIDTIAKTFYIINESIYEPTNTKCFKCITQLINGKQYILCIDSCNDGSKTQYSMLKAYVINKNNEPDDIQIDNLNSQNLWHNTKKPWFIVDSDSSFLGTEYRSTKCYLVIDGNSIYGIRTKPTYSCGFQNVALPTLNPEDNLIKNLYINNAIYYTIIKYTQSQNTLSYYKINNYNTKLPFTDNAIGQTFFTEKTITDTIAIYSNTYYDFYNDW
jgi:hypothetical protein